MVDGRNPVPQRSYKHIGSKLAQNLNDKELSKYHEKKNIIHQKNIENEIEMFATHNSAERKQNRKSPLDSPSNYSKVLTENNRPSSLQKSIVSRNMQVSNRVSHQTTQPYNVSETDDRYKLKIRSSVRSKNQRRNENVKMKS